MNASRFASQRRDIERRFRDTPGRINKAMSKLVAQAGATVIVVEKRVIGWRLKTGEIVCAKARFQTEAAATAKLNYISETNSGSHIPVRAYECSYCHGWHMTSQQRKGI